MQLITYSESDINREFARRAFDGTSHFSERRGDGIISGYIADMEALVTEFSQWATDKNRAEMAQDLEYYRVKYLELLKDYLASHSNVVSAFIVGPANFPTRRNEKRGRWADNHRDKWLNFCRDQLEKLRRKYDPKRIANAPIQSDDPEAIEKLQAKLDNLKRSHEMMKAANKVVRCKIPDEEKIAGMVELGFKESTARQLLQPDYMSRKGYPQFALSNNLANIKRIEGRISQLERQAKAEPKEIEYPDGITVEESSEDARIRIRFPGKPDYDTRSRLKSLGFRWSPKNTAWQRHLNTNGRVAVERFLEGYPEAV